MSLEQNYTAILGQLGEDVSREGLLDTPKRAAKAMQYLCRGYEQTLEEVTNGALFKSHVNTWLRQHPQVLGFTSCQAKHGGAGAVYVMLKRTMMEGRDE